ncbi:MAG: hypothetical protein ACRECX_14800 [Methyloceanibacter sp.]|uniref:hypothetical protein n=1 Tax=Methyloceanibacter sp. TaxID=1965321 RepID=UPI003D6DA860
MTMVTIRGLAALRRRLDAKDMPAAVKNSLRRDAEAVAAAAARAAPGDLGRTVEVRDISDRERMAYAVGTPHRAGRFLEYGTVRMRAQPWLFPAFRARLPRIKQSLGNSLAASFGQRRGAV